MLFGFSLVWCAGSQEMQPSALNNNICSNHEECEGRSSKIKLTKGFSAKESVKGHMASSFVYNLNCQYILFNNETQIHRTGITSFSIKKQLDIAE